MEAVEEVDLAVAAEDGEEAARVADAPRALIPGHAHVAHVMLREQRPQLIGE